MLLLLRGKMKRKKKVDIDERKGRDREHKGNTNYMKDLINISA